MPEGTSKEERRKKLEEIKGRALAAQRFKEQKELERQQRLEELSSKYGTGEREEDSIFRRNQERKARMEAKRRNERSSMVFAFGSSTPRMLEPTDSIGSFWGHRRAASTQNITSAAPALTRRQSERDLTFGSKKRATSTGGLERSGDGMPPQTPAGCASGFVGRRWTDLMPTIPARDLPPGARKPFARSPASSRPSSSLSQQSNHSVASSVNLRARPVAAPRRPRPVSIAVTGVSSPASIANDKNNTKPPLPKSRKSSLVKSQRKPVGSPTSGVAKQLASPTIEVIPPAVPLPTAASNENIIIKPKEKVESVVPKKLVTEQLVDAPVAEPQEPPSDVKRPQEESEIKPQIIQSEPLKEMSASLVDNLKPKDSDESQEVVDMSASMTKVRITTEEEAKAALAERRRVAREEAERQAEMERFRIEEEARIEFEQQQKEEEMQRVLIEQMRAAEQARLEEAIKEAAKREEEELLRKENEARQKQMKEEADRKAREEAEKQKAMLQERLKNEEIEREERRKRIEAIMLRTRKKNSNEKLDSSKMGTSENGHKNGKDIETVDNIIPVESLKNANTINANELSTDDNSW